MFEAVLYVVMPLLWHGTTRRQRQRRQDSIDRLLPLAQIAARFPHMNPVACNRCDRRCRLSTARLLARHGADFPGPELRRTVAADCPPMIEGKIADPCGAHFPGLATSSPTR
jgi:hypothetical protein